MPNIYDHHFRIKYKNVSESERNKMLTQFEKDHYPKIYRWAKAKWQRSTKQEADDIFQESLIVFHTNLLTKEGEEKENLSGLFYAIFCKLCLKKIEKIEKDKLAEQKSILPNDKEKEDILSMIVETILSEKSNSLNGYCKTYYKNILEKILDPENESENRKLIEAINQIILNNPNEFNRLANPNENQKIPINLERIHEKNTDCRKKLRYELEIRGIFLKK